MKQEEKEKIWIIDDDPGILEVVQIILDEQGYHTTALSSSTELELQLQQESLPSLILLDILISGSHGADIAKRLRSDNATMSIPIVMVSANIHTKEIAAEAGVDDFLLKPFNIDELEAMVKKYLKK